MEPLEYDKLDRVEDRLWWFAAAHANLLALHDRLAPPDSVPTNARAPVLDAGCGTGGLLAKLGARHPDRIVLGLDVDAGACARARAKSTRPVCTGSIDRLPFADAVFAAIFSADVLCHRDVDEERALAQFHRCLGNGGVLVLNLPAYRWMLSRHDDAVDNVRRYTARGLAALLRATGFRLVYAGYWNTLLFPLMVVTRKLMGGRGAAVSDVRLQSRPVEMLCRAATGLEGLVLRAGLRLPFGGSVLAVALKEDRMSEGAARG